MQSMSGTSNPGYVQEVSGMSEYGDEVVEEMQVTGEQVGNVTRTLDSGAEAPRPRPRRAETKKLDPEPELTPRAVTPSSFLGVTREEMIWAALAHASVLLTLLLGLASGGIAAILGPIVPAIIWYVYRDKSDYVADQARQATIFQLAGFVALLALAIVGAILIAVGWAVSAVLVIVLVGLILLPIMLIVSLVWIVALVALPIAMVVYGCYGALEAYNGRPFRYYWVAEMIDRYQAQA
jgi:uncharacterized Tic20 family protein